MTIQQKFALIFFSLLAGNNAFASTEGSYLGADILYSKGYFTENYSYYGTSFLKDSTKFRGSDLGGGINYKHAFNYEGFYIAPGAFLEYNNLSMKKNNLYYNGIHDTRQLDITSRLGIKADIGYDLTEDLAFYLTAGYGMVRYRAKNIYYNSPSTVIERNKSGFTGSAFYGAGLKFHIIENLYGNLEFNIQNLDIRTKTNVEGDITSKRGTYITKIFISKLGLSYQF